VRGSSRRGKGSKIKRNGSGDMIFINKNKGIVIRADIKRPYPDTRPHVHIEFRKPNGKHVPYKNQLIEDTLNNIS